MHLSAGEARRVAVAAAGLNRPRPRRPDRRHLARLVQDVHVIQLDSVNVIARAHDLCVFSRLGPHPTSLLRDAAYRHRELAEAICHAACLVPTSDLPLLRWRHEERIHPWWREWSGENQRLLDAVLDEVRDRGPLAAGQLSFAGKSRGSWWGWSDTKRAFECLFVSGELAVADRGGVTGFERLYDVPERVHPPEVLTAPEPERDDAQAALVERASRSLGVATTFDLADYHRLPTAAVKRVLPGLVEQGLLIPVEVEGWKQPAFLHQSASRPKRADGRALLSPFDPLVWFRRRAERLFDFHYRIEIYTPEPKRVYGYYVLPFLLGDRLVARVDLKADRKAGVLAARGTYAEPGTDLGEVAEGLASELAEMATWVGLGRVAVEDRGDLAPKLLAAVEAVA